MKRIKILVALLCTIQWLSAQTEPMIYITESSSGRNLTSVPVSRVDEIVIEEVNEKAGFFSNLPSEFLREKPEYSLFLLALKATQVELRLHAETEDPDYMQLDPDYYSRYQKHDLSIEVPSKRLLSYTCFIEPDAVYEAAIPALKNASNDTDRLRLLQEYALNWFCDAYSDVPQQVVAARNDTYPLDDEHNYFNKFVAYHFVNKKIDKVDFSRYQIGMSPMYARLKEYAETLAPGQMIYMSAGKNGNSKQDPNLLQLNPSPDNEISLDIANRDWTYPSKDGVILANAPTKETANGFFHEVTSVLTYPRKDFKKMRFRMDLSSLFPEIMSNNFRYKYEKQGRIVFPDGYLSNIRNLSPGAVFVMISPNRNASGGYNGYQGDEFFMYNSYDFILRLPPVPAGMYEIRLGFSTSSARGAAQFYLGTSENKLLPCGIPVDLTKTANNYGWLADSDWERDYLNDLVMHTRGWMKGPDSWLCNNGNNVRSLRDTEVSSGYGHSPLRYVIGTVSLQNDGPIYVRVRNATSFQEVELMMDYFEICPANIYDNPMKPEPRD